MPLTPGSRLGPCEIVAPLGAGEMGQVSDHPHVRTDFESNWKMRGCPAFKEKCYLSPYRDVLPCPFIQVSIGNVRRESLGRIRATALSHHYLQSCDPICIAAEDRHFIDSAGCYGVDISSLPISHKDPPLFTATSRP